MLCELCGNNTNRLICTKIEGSVLEVCPDCSNFGNPQKKDADTSNTNVSGDIMSTLKKRQQRARGRDVIGQRKKILSLDFNKIVIRGRQKIGWTQKELANKINEKQSLIANVERGKMKPDNKVRKKLENCLNIELEEDMPDEKLLSTGNSGPLTIGDLILIAKKNAEQKG